VSVTLEARLGETTMAVADLLGLRSGAVLSLDRRIDDPVDLYLNGALVARGEIVTVDNMFGVRIVEVAPK
jgi:flagellar motor switch protein FliN/FliY